MKRNSTLYIVSIFFILFIGVLLIRSHTFTDNSSVSKNRKIELAKTVEAANSQCMDDADSSKSPDGGTYSGNTGYYNQNEGFCYNVGATSAVAYNCTNPATNTFSQSDCHNGNRCNLNGKTAVCDGSTPIPFITSQIGSGTCTVPGTQIQIKQGFSRCKNNVIYQCQQGGTPPKEVPCKDDVNTKRSCTDSAGDMPPTFACTEGPVDSQGSTAALTATPAPGYWIPQPGYNCGRTVGDPEADDLSTSCCNSAIASWGDLPVDSVDLGPFDDIPLMDKLKAFVLQGLSSSFNSLPLPIDLFNFADKSPFSVKNIKKALNSVPVCLPGGIQSTASRKDPTCKCIVDPDSGKIDLSSLSSLCNAIKNNGEKAQCVSCVGGQHNVFGGGIWTGLGCINVSENGFINSAVNIGISLGGGFSLMCIIYAAFLLQTSGGSPEAIKKARDLMTSCITGLLLMIFAVFILRLIGYDILKLPGFGN